MQASIPGALLRNLAVGERRGTDRADTLDGKAQEAGQGGSWGTQHRAKTRRANNQTAVLRGPQ